MGNNANHFANAGMLIRKPVEDVFEAFIDPAITTKFWFTKSSGKLLLNNSVVWTWEMYDHSVAVKVNEIIPNEKIAIQWGDDPDARVVWEFKTLSDGNTFVDVKNTGFKGDCEELINQIRDSTGGFSWVLSGLKAYLEHGIELNLIGDRYPRELGKH